MCSSVTTPRRSWCVPRVPALDDLVARLVGAGVGVRELAPVVAPLEAAFLALTAAANVPSDDEDQ